MDTAKDFLATGQKFQLGFLETEKPHPKTMQLSQWAQNDLNQAIETLAQIDSDALEILKTKIPEILNLRKDIQKTWAAGGRVFLCGCGATGRLSLTLEFLYRQACEHDKNLQEKVVAFMAGGDVALVHSLEGFEDFPEYGERHLLQLGFTKNDLLLSPTEGGETPFVIGATEAAAKLSVHKPYFLYCNPDAVLTKHVERSRKVIENSNINKINLSVGPMALAGSTRMQASTVLQLAIGLAMLTQLNENQMRVFLSELQSYITTDAPTFLKPFIEKESAEYLAGRYILYCVKDYSITVFTDTTERAPTFSLTPFSHRKAERLLKLSPSKCYICIPEAKTNEEAWQKLLLRPPRKLNWPEIDERTCGDYLKEFDFSTGAKEFRKWLTKDTEHSDFEIFRHEETILWRLQDHEAALMLPADTTPLFEHTLLKMLLNIHSTLIMGRLGRYKSNMMTWVYPTNGKLIDRASRFVKTLLHEDGIEVEYSQVVEALFAARKRITGNESIVLATYEDLKKISAQLSV